MHVTMDGSKGGGGQRSRSKVKGKGSRSKVKGQGHSEFSNIHSSKRENSWEKSTTRLGGGGQRSKSKVKGQGYSEFSNIHSLKRENSFENNFSFQVIIVIFRPLKPL